MATRRTSWIVSLASALGALAAPAGAHHSFAAIFDVTKEMTISGRVSGVEWVNPHIYVHVDTTGADGKPVTWRFETLPPNWMRRAGIKREDVLNGNEPGQPVTVLAYAPRDPAQHVGFLLRLTYQDGHYLQLYNDPSAPKP